MTFKVGDKVKVWGSPRFMGAQEATIKEVLQPDGRYNNADKYLIVYDKGGEDIWWNENDMALLGPVNFILQYELDSDPFETFSTMEQVQSRIKELAKRPNLKRDSIKIYEVSKTYDVSIETRVVLGAILGDKVAMKKRGRKPKAAMTEKEKKSAYMRRWYKKNKARIKAMKKGLVPSGYPVHEGVSQQQG